MIKRISLLILVFILAANSGIADNYLDSLKRVYASAKTDTAKFNTLYKIIQEYLETAHKNFNPDSATVPLDRVVEELRSQNDPHRLESFLYLKALSFLRKRQYDRAEEYCDSCIAIANSLKDHTELGSIFLLKEMVYHLMNLDERRVQSLYKAIENFQKAGSLDGQAGAYFSLGNIYAANLKNDLAIENYLKGARLRNQLNDSIGAGIDYLFCATIEMKMGNLDNAGEYIRMARPVIHSRVVFQPLYYYAINGRWLKAMGKKKEALQNLSAAADLAVKANQRYQKPTALCDMAEVLISEKKFAQAKALLDEAAAISGKEKFLSIKINVRNVLSKYFEAIHKPALALREYKVMQMLKDSSNQNELSRVLTSSAMEAEYNKKEAERTELQRIRDEETAQKLRRQKIVAWSAAGILFSVVCIVFLLYRSYRQKKRDNAIIAAEKKRSDDLLRNILPDDIATELKATGTSKARYFQQVTVLFTDFKNFTSLSEKLTAQQLVNEIHFYYSAFDTIISSLGLEKIKTIGDSYMCAGGVPAEDSGHSINSVRAALEIRDFVRREKEERIAKEVPYFDIRIGLHSGPVVAGIVGTKKFAYDIWGDTVNIASRMESSGEPGKVNISSSTYELVKKNFICDYRGKIEAKNKGMIDMYFVEGVL
jgi:adenylate cyclase